MRWQLRCFIAIRILGCWRRPHSRSQGPEYSIVAAVSAEFLGYLFFFGGRALARGKAPIPPALMKYFISRNAGMPIQAPSRAWPHARLRSEVVVAHATGTGRSWLISNFTSICAVAGISHVLERYQATLRPLPGACAVHIAVTMFSVQGRLDAHETLFYSCHLPSCCLRCP